MEIIVFLFIFGGFGLCILLACNLNSRREVQLGLLARKLGLAVTSGGHRLLKEPILAEGTHRGKPMRIYSYTTGISRRVERHLAIAAQVANPKGLTFQFHEENVFSKLGKAVGMQDVKVGDVRFDQRFIVCTNAPAFICAALLPEIKAQFHRAWDLRALGCLELEGNEVRYCQAGPLFDDTDRARFEVLAGLLADLAAVVEVYNR